VPNVTYTLYGGTLPAGAASAAQSSALDVGLQFTVSLSGYVLSGYWWYVDSGGDTNGAHYSFSLFTTANGTTGSLVSGSQVTGSGTWTVGWNYTALASPVTLSTGTTYVAAGTMPATLLEYDNNYWSSGGGSAGVTSGPVSAPSAASALGGATQRFNSPSTGGFPATAPGVATWYGIDVAVTGPPVPVGNPSGGPWANVFAEEFSTPVQGPLTMVPDPAVWTDHILWGDATRCAQGNGSAGSDQSWSPHNKAGISVSGGQVSLITRNESPYSPSSVGYDPLCPNPDAAGLAAAFTSGILSSAPGFAYTYGYAEARIKIPVGVTGIHPAFWSTSRTGDWGPEIDMMEYIAGTASSTVWSIGANPTQLYHVSAPVVDGNWHVWGMRWSASDVTFFLDGTQYGTYTGAGIASFPNLIYLVQQVDSPNNGAPGYPCSLVVDYVRVWTVQGVPAQPVITSVSPAGGKPTSGTLTASFSPVSGATSYRAVACPVDMGADGLSEPGPYLSATGSSSPLTISGLTNGARYFVSVSAINATGYSIESLPVPSIAPPAGALLVASFP
jgi:Glycosyl hydrolases family 16/Domain of unknown function (DUF4082)